MRVYIFNCLLFIYNNICAYYSHIYIYTLYDDVSTVNFVIPDQLSYSANALLFSPGCRPPLPGENEASCRFLGMEGDPFKILIEMGQWSVLMGLSLITNLINNFAEKTLLMTI